MPKDVHMQYSMVVTKFKLDAGGRLSTKLIIEGTCWGPSKKLMEAVTECTGMYA